MKQFILISSLFISFTLSADNFTVYIQFDEFPEEVTWELYNEDGTELFYRSYTYDPYQWQHKLLDFNFSFEPSENCYLFRIYDSYGDGICCAYGNGSYYIEDEDGNRLLTGAGNFGYSAEARFCLDDDDGGGTEVAYSCTDGEMNGSETGIDCGGIDCFPCQIGTQPLVQRTYTHTKVSKYPESNFLTATSKIESDLKGERIVWSTYDPVFTGSRKVYTATTDGLEFHEIFDFVGTGPLFAPPMVDISGDGTKILFTNGNDKIYVSNFDGSGRYVIVDDITVSGTTFEPELRSAPQFSGSQASPLNIYFIHTDFGPNGTGQAAERAGLFFAAVNGSMSQPTQIFSAKNVAELYGADASTYTPLGGLFGPKVSEGNLILFGTGDYTNSGGSHLWTNLNTSFEKITENGPFALDTDAMDISGDGITIVWHDGANDWYSIKTTTPNIQTNYPKFEEFDTFGSNVLSTNFYGTRTVVQSAGADNLVIITSSGQVHFPLYVSKYSDMFNGVGSATLARSADKIFYQSDDDESNIYMTAFGVDGRPGSIHPTMEDFDFSKNWVLENEGNAEFRIRVNGGSENVDFVNFVELTHSNRPLSILNNFSNHYLYNDGSTLGDEFIDDIFTHNNVYEQSYTEPSVPDTFTVRINLFGENYSSSYDIYPFFLLNSPLTSTSETLENIDSASLYPNIIQTECNLIINSLNNQDITYQICDFQGRELYTSELNYLTQGQNNIPVNVSNLSKGIYTLIVTTKEGRYPIKFIKI